MIRTFEMKRAARLAPDAARDIASRGSKNTCSAAKAPAVWLNSIERARQGTNRSSVRPASQLEASVTSGMMHYERLFGSSPAKRYRHQAGIDRTTLPTPLSYLVTHGLLVRKPRAEWVAIRCPAHKGGTEMHPSLRVSLLDGHFKCHACDASGGDLVALHRLITGLGFRAAVDDLGGRFYD
jgi:hypothetical protein